MRKYKNTDEEYKKLDSDMIVLQLKNRVEELQNNQKQIIEGIETLAEIVEGIVYRCNDNQKKEKLVLSIVDEELKKSIETFRYNFSALCIPIDTDPEE
ncbi:MAG: hypothetical protein PHP92_05060 [Candidatus Nanoarchaeia archaeon]|nr:hypothetical protein [Candidatus Nanoarchaeia archaeon]